MPFSPSRIRETTCLTEAKFHRNDRNMSPSSSDDLMATWPGWSGIRRREERMTDCTSQSCVLADLQRSEDSAVSAEYGTSQLQLH